MRGIRNLGGLDFQLMAFNYVLLTSLFRNRANRNALFDDCRTLGKDELCPVNPQAMYDHSKLFGNRNHRVCHAIGLGNRQTLSARGDPFLGSQQYASHRFANRAAHIDVTLLGAAAININGAALPFSRRQPKMPNLALELKKRLELSTSAWTNGGVIKLTPKCRGRQPQMLEN